MTRLTEDYKTEKNTLSGIIGDVEDADPNEVAVKINSLQIQLEASYRVTASMSDLSLAYLL
jgi:flagellin-like hook-associated protein FlgL